MFIKELMKTFHMDGQEVVLLVYVHSGQKVILYAVPVDVADELRLDEYDNAEILKDDIESIIHKIQDYEVEDELDSGRLCFVRAYSEK